MASTSNEQLYEKLKRDDIDQGGDGVSSTTPHVTLPPFNMALVSTRANGVIREDGSFICNDGLFPQRTVVSFTYTCTHNTRTSIHHVHF